MPAIKTTNHVLVQMLSLSVQNTTNLSQTSLEIKLWCCLRNIDHDRPHGLVEEDVDQLDQTSNLSEELPGYQNAFWGE